MTVEKLKNYEPLFGAWTVESKIAEGRHSKVFRVKRTTDGEAEYQCLKTVKFPSGDEELSRVISSGLYQNIGQYLEEVEMNVIQSMDKMLTLRTNPNIVRFDDYTIIKESSCFHLVILMELLTPMSDYLKIDSVSQNDAIDLGCDICAALQGFREAGIIHHEVKPENIYVDSNGNFKLGDFGISKTRYGEQGVVSSYIAPELYKEDEPDCNSDVYSLGILLYKLLNNNRLPFLPSYPAPVSIDDRENAFAKRMRGDLFPAPSGATSQLANVLYKAAAFRSSERFSDPYALAVALHKHYIMPEQETPTEAFAPPAAPVNPYHITDDSSVPLYEQSPVQHSEVTDEEKDDFAEVFADNEDDADESEGEKVSKKWYFIIVALVLILTAIVGFIAKDSFKKETTTTTAPLPDITFGEQTTFPTTTGTTTTATTTTETTTTETTTETTTTATTTTETTTVTTTATTTTETTTTETTTESTTQTTEPTSQEPSDLLEDPTDEAVDGYTEPILVYSLNIVDGQDTRGRLYKEMLLTVEEGFGEDNEVRLVAEGLEGENAESIESYVNICTMDGVRMIKRSPAIVLIETESSDIITFSVTADDDTFSFEPDKYQYFICLEDGAIGTDSTVSLGMQIRVTE